MSEILHVGDNSGDEFLDVLFYKNIYQDEETDFIRIGIPGDKSVTIDTVADETHKRRFSRKWQAYVGLQSLSGTPIHEWTDIPEPLRNEFAYQGFRFVEQVAGSPDSAFTRIMGGVQWRTKAQSFLNKGKVNESEIIKTQSEQIRLLQEQMKAILDNPPKRGRKTKDIEEPEPEPEALEE
jgi:hypothetical protein